MQRITCRNSRDSEFDLRCLAEARRPSRRLSTRVLRLVCASAINATLLLACSATDSTSTMTRVELDIFSGRPNPSWTITASEADTLSALLAGLPKGVAPAEVALGYRGFIVGVDAPSSPITGTTRVFSGTVSRDQLHFVDSKGAEKWLMTNARTHGFSAMIDSIPPH